MEYSNAEDVVIDKMAGYFVETIPFDKGDLELTKQVLRILSGIDNLRHVSISRQKCYFSMKICDVACRGYDFRNEPEGRAARKRYKKMLGESERTGKMLSCGVENDTFGWCISSENWNFWKDLD